MAQKRCRVATVVKEGAGLVERHKLELVGTDIVKPVAVPAAAEMRLNFVEMADGIVAGNSVETAVGISEIVVVVQL